MGGALVIGALGCSSDPDPDKPVPQAALEVEDSTCLLIDDALGAEVTDLPVVDCNLAHTHEVFSVVNDTDNEVYPGMATLEQFAEQQCYGTFEEYVGISPFDSSLFITWLVPSLDGWNDEKDREILCVLGRKDGGQMTRSARASQL